MNIRLAKRGVLLAMLIALPALAGPLDRFSDSQLTSALRLALNQSADKSTAALGTPDGFLKNPKVRIPLPPALKRLEGLLKTFGLQHETQALVLAMNRAAESAVPQARIVVLDSIRKMSVTDARGILTGPADSATLYFKRTTQEPLTKLLLPIIQQTTAKVGLAKAYGSLAKRGARYGVVDADSADLDAWVTRKTLDGLYLTIGEQERAIRQDPLGQGSKLLRDVFGTL